MKALREAVANALIHRDYSISRESAYIYVQIYNDRIEIINPGDLYGNNRLENLGTDMMLEARNKNLVRLLEEKGNIIENRHTGIATMREEMRKMGLPEPEFQSLRGDFKVIFRKEILESNEVGTTSETTPKTTPKTTSKVHLKDLNATQIKILNIISKQPTITKREIATIIGITEDGVKYNIKVLKDKNLLERIGFSKNGYWKLNR